MIDVASFDAKSLRRFLGRIVIADGCWLWNHSCDKDGYGSFTLNCRQWRCNRLMWTLLNGPIDRSVHILHKCDTAACIRPDHLFSGSNLDNMKDMDAKGRRMKYGMAKLSPEGVREIRQDPRSQTAIAAERGISQSVVSSVKLRKIWKDIQ